jgi:hypothetical protein
MKAARPILVIAGSALILCVAHASFADPRSQRRLGNSTSKTSARSNDEGQARTARQTKDQKSASVSREHVESAHVPNKTGNRTQAKLTMPSRPKQVRSIRGLARSDHALHAQQPTLTGTRVVTGRIATAHASVIWPSTGSAIGGQQFRHSRNLAAVPAALGGSANSKKNTAAISGSEIHSKH